MKSFDVGKTERGFGILHFEDAHNVKGSLQKSSIASYDAIRLGVSDAEPKILASKIIDGGTGWAKYPIPDEVFINTRMVLSREDVKKLLPYLQAFVETGEKMKPYNWIVVERHDGKTHYTSGLDFGTARKLFCKITAAGGNAWMKNYIGGGKCMTLFSRYHRANSIKIFQENKLEV